MSRIFHAAVSMLFLIFFTAQAYGVETTTLARQYGWAAGIYSLKAGRLCALEFTDQTTNRISLGFDGRQFSLILMGIAEPKPNDRIDVRITAERFRANLPFESGADPKIYSRYLSTKNAIGLLEQMANGQVRRLLFEGPEKWMDAGFVPNDEVGKAMLGCVSKLTDELKQDPAAYAKIPTVDGVEDEPNAILRASDEELRKQIDELAAAYIYWGGAKACAPSGMFFKPEDVEEASRLVKTIISANEIDKATADNVWDRASPHLREYERNPARHICYNASLGRYLVQKYLPPEQVSNPFTR